MQHIEQPIGPVRPQRSRKRRFLRSLCIGVGSAVLVVGIFWFGVNVGSGRLQLQFGPGQTAGTSGLPAELDFSEVQQLYATLKQYYDGDLTVDDIMDGIKSGLISATGDAYTEYMNAEEAASFNGQLSGTFSGIGAEIGKNDQDQLIVVSPISGFPAEKAGLKAQDIIATIDGESTSGLTVNEAVLKIRGEKGTDVKLGIVRDGESKTITITRDTISIPSVEYEVRDDGIGYIQINQFWTDTGGLVKEAAAAFQAADVKGVVLDLRGNPGGSLDAAVEVANQWLPAGKTILQEKRDGMVVESFTAKSGGTLLGMPTVVLIDEGSASASEIVAGALKDNAVATLVGTKSYGKGSVQQIIELKDGGQLKVTIARWYRPNGENIDKEGITPDKTVEFDADAYEAGVDVQLNAALAELE